MLFFCAKCYYFFPFTRFPVLTVYFLNSITGNINLHKGSTKKSHMFVIIGSSIGAAVLLMATIASCLFLRKGTKGYYEEGRSLKPTLLLCLPTIFYGRTWIICLFSSQITLLPFLHKDWLLQRAMHLQKLLIASVFLKLKMLQITLRRRLDLEVLELYTMGYLRMEKRLLSKC